MTLANLEQRVFFIDPPDIALSNWLFDSVSGYPMLTVVRGPRLAPGLRFYPRTLRHWLEMRWLARLESQVGCKIDIVWQFENSRFYDLTFAGSRLKIYHQVDLNQNFRPETAATTADICFCTTDFIRERLVPYNPRVYKIHHGLAKSTSPQRPTTTQQDYFVGGVKHAVYIGNLDMVYLDADLLSETARYFPDVRFHFVGSYSKKGKLWQSAGNLANVIWWGKVDSTLIPSILERADVLLVTYQAAHWQDQASPHKLMEYLASGKTIVATYTDEYKDQRYLLEMVDKNADYLATFGRVIGALGIYNSPHRQAERKAFAETHTYYKQLDRIFALLQQHKLLTS